MPNPTTVNIGPGQSLKAEFAVQGTPQPACGQPIVNPAGAVSVSMLGNVATIQAPQSGLTNGQTITVTYVCVNNCPGQPPSYATGLIVLNPQGFADSQCEPISGATSTVVEVAPCIPITGATSNVVVA